MIRLCLSIGPLSLNVPEYRWRWRLNRYTGSWCLFVGPFFSLAWWKGWRGIRVGFIR